MMTLGDLRPDRAVVVGPHARQRIFQAFAAGRWDIVRAAPIADLRLAPFLAGFVFVQSRKLTVVALIQGRIAHDRNVGLIKLGEDDVERVLGALQDAGECDVELRTVIADHAAGDASFNHAFLGQVRIAPPGEQIEPVPFALSVAHEHENIVCQRVCHSLVNTFAMMRSSEGQEMPSTSVMA